MAIELLANGGFSRGWIDLLPYGALTNQQPHGYALTIRRPGMPLVSSGPGGYTGPDETPIYNVVVVVPEVVHKHNMQLPPEERLGGSKALVLDGEYTLKVFSAVNPFSVDLTAWVVAPAAGKITITIPVQVHDHGDPSVGAAVWRVVVGGTPFGWKTFGAGFLSRQWSRFQTEIDVDAGQAVEIMLQMESRALGGIDFFTDGWSATFVATEQPGSVDGSTPGGYPARALVVDYGLITDQERRRTLYLEACDRGIVVGPSHDHVRSWPPGAGSYVVELSGIPVAKQGEFVTYYAARSPEITLVFRDTPDALVTPPQVGGEPPPYVLRNCGRNLIGLHSGFVRSQTWPYIANSGVTVQKFFSAGDCWLCAQKAPDCMTIWRKYVGTLPSLATAKASAVWYRQQYSAELASAAKALGISVSALVETITAVESYNEMVPTYSPDVLRWAVDFDCYFADDLYAEYGGDLRPVVLNVAVGNPHESEVEMLLPAAQAAEAYGGFVGYHSYWARSASDKGYLESGWWQHAGRWQAWDKVFTAHGCFPRYVSTESGICFANDGWSFNPVLGWKAVVSFEVYLRDIAEYNRRAVEWNATHANRFAGACLFGYGNWGWESFELGDGEVALLQNWAFGTPIAQTVRTGADEALGYVMDLRAYLRSANYISREHRALLKRALEAKVSL